ncbi:DUF4276 family protein [Chryseobacterium sp. 18068]|uniref:DUF4276 family protein n=1 Tax=Chryseobacterium sp. 18068 TaxID=2681414 RepID=UPI00135B4BFD|nr:DUF4276 family protein [Chryseobacterium sp. 18068]
MRAVYIIAEGQTEEQFINEILRPYFLRFNIYDVRAILMETSPGYKGGDVIYSRYKYNIELLLKKESDIIVTSLIDYYKLDTGFPNYNEALKIHDKFIRLDNLEESIRRDIPNPRFIPYIQLHEFEGLLFSSMDGFNYLTNIPENSLKCLEKIVNSFENPELINDGVLTAPSKRLVNLIPGYQKTFHGPIIADEINIDVIISKCKRFENWLNEIINLYNQ